MLIHRMWLGPRPMPARFRAYGQAWRDLNPECEVTDWSWHNLPADLANGDVLDDLRRRCTRGDSIELATALADVICYDLVFRFGGVYLNCDIEPVRPLPGQMTDGAPWASMEDQVHVVNAAFGGAAGSEPWRLVVEELLPARYWRLRAAGEEEMNQLTGPHLLGELLAVAPGCLRVFARETFCPLHFLQIPEGGTAEGLWAPGHLPPGTVGVHHWDHRRTGRSNVVS
jgi:inositol phosphorylceramide mannosyltransferase catalytic subunit